MFSIGHILKVLDYMISSCRLGSSVLSGLLSSALWARWGFGVTNWTVSSNASTP